MKFNLVRNFNRYLKHLINIFPVIYNRYGDYDIGKHHLANALKQSPTPELLIKLGKLLRNSIVLLPFHTPISIMFDGFLSFTTFIKCLYLFKFHDGWLFFLNKRFSNNFLILNILVIRVKLLLLINNKKVKNYSLIKLLF